MPQNNRTGKVKYGKKQQASTKLALYSLMEKFSIIKHLINHNNISMVERYILANRDTK